VRKSRRCAKPPFRCMQTDDSAVKKNVYTEKIEKNAVHFKKYLYLCGVKFYKK
jgi:hypothetical protein